jgi:transposase
MRSGSTRRRFSREFKFKAVQHARKQGLTVQRAAAEFSIQENTLYRWIREYDRYGDSAFPGNGRARLVEDELAQLRRENAELAMELEILREAAAWMKKRTH